MSETLPLQSLKYLLSFLYRKLTNFCLLVIYTIIDLILQQMYIVCWL